MMIGEQLTYVLNDLAYIASIGVAIGFIIGGVICLVAGVIIILQDDPNTVGWVPYPRGVDNDDDDS